MNSTFKLIVLILLMSNTFFTFFIAYDIYGKALIKEKTETAKINREIADYKRKITTLYYTNFIDSYNFTYSEVSNINVHNILNINTDLLFNVSYNCIILDASASETCNNLFKEMNNKKISFVNSIKNVTSSYEIKLGTIAFQSTTFDDYNKEIESIVGNIMKEKDFEKAQGEYLQSLKAIKDFLELEYTKSFDDI